MKALVIGSGGREHALAHKLSESPLISVVYCAPGNGGTAVEKKCENLPLNEIDKLVDFAKSEGIGFTIVGPENYLVEGVVDSFKKEGLKILGPSMEAARLEGSKIYAKEFMKKYGVRTAQYEVFDDHEIALEYIEICSFPVVVKADGLAAGKGVVICQSIDEARKAIEDFMVADTLAGSGKTIVIEEYLEGYETSILSITDGETILPFVSARDNKRIFDGNEGPNTGGMGAVAPNPDFTREDFESFKMDIMEPTLNGIKEEGLDYTGIIFFGLMITKKGPYLLEYNVRMGDPETQAVLPLMKSDFAELVLKALDKKLSTFNIEWEKGSSCCVIAASKGYPLKYETGKEIFIGNVKGKVFIAGAVNENGILKTSGGRVLSVVAKGYTLEIAREKAYEDIRKVEFEGMYYRKDI